MPVAATETFFFVSQTSDSSTKILKGAEQCMKQIGSHPGPLYKSVALNILGKFLVSLVRCLNKVLCCILAVSHKH